MCYPVWQFRCLLRVTESGKHVLGKGLLTVDEARPTETGQVTNMYVKLKISLNQFFWQPCRIPHTQLPDPQKSRSNVPYTQTHNTCEDPAHTWQIRLRDSTAKLTYEPQKDGPEQHLGLDIVQDLLQHV